MLEFPVQNEAVKWSGSKRLNRATQRRRPARDVLEQTGSVYKRSESKTKQNTNLRRPRKIADGQMELESRRAEKIWKGCA